MYKLQTDYPTVVIKMREGEDIEKWGGVSEGYRIGGADYSWGGGSMEKVKWLIAEKKKFKADERMQTGRSRLLSW